MRVLVLGTSHAATLRQAFPQIGTAFPGVSLSFWGLPGAAFQKAVLGADGVLRPDPLDPVGLRKAAEWNGAASLDLAPFDRIFLVGLRYGLGALMPVLRDLQPLDWGRRKGALGVSEPFLAAAIEAEVGAAVSAQAARTPFDARFTVMPAPYPAESAARSRAKGGAPLTRAVASLPAAGRLMALFEAALIRAHARLGVALRLQPRDTLAAPLLTFDRFLHDPAQDARHMNADYGLIAFRALMASEPDRMAASPAPASA